MHELTEERHDERPTAGAVAAPPALAAEPDDPLDEETAIRERLRQIRLESAHIPVAHEPPPSLVSRLKGLFRR